MSKTKISYMCSSCGDIHQRHSGKCKSCGEYGTIVEYKETDNINETRKSWVSSTNSDVILGKDIVEEERAERIDTEISEFNVVLGGGLVPDSVNLISGEPGVGKSTLLIQAAVNLSKVKKVLYTSGEESLFQIKSRARRLMINDDEIMYLSETNVEKIIEKIEKNKAEVIIIDSIQTIYTNTNKSSAGSSSQLRESAQLLNDYAKNKNVTFLIIGHVTKDGSVAGPKILEHIVDGVFQIEGDKNSKYKIMRTYKNRFGDTSEIGIFAMTEKGMKSVSNPSAMFLSSSKTASIGSSIVITKEGRRSIMYEIQSLITTTELEIPKRLTIGFNNQRFQMLLAIMQKHIKINQFKKDIYVSIVGGIQIPTEDTSIDLPLAFSIYSSLNDFSIPKNIASFGEVSLTGEVRPVPAGEDRIKEAEKHGMEYVFISKDNKLSSNFSKNLKIKIIAIEDIKDAIQQLDKITKNK